MGKFWGVKMKRILTLLICLILVIVLSSCVSGGKSLNVKIMETTKSTVRFRPVCPECDAVGQSRTEIMYAGEGDTFTDVAICDECFHMFNIGITRD